MTVMTAQTAQGPRTTMGRHLDRVGAVARKDLHQWARDRQALAGPMLIPLVLMFLCGVLFGFGGDDWNIGLVNRGTGPHAAALEQEIRDLRSNISPYFHVVTTTPTRPTAWSPRAACTWWSPSPRSSTPRWTPGGPPYSGRGSTTSTLT